MKRFLIGMVMLLLAFSLFAQLSGSSSGTIGYDVEGNAPVYSLETGVAFTAGVFSIGATASTETFLGADLEVPIGITTDNFSIEVTPSGSLYASDNEVVDGGAVGDFNTDLSVAATLGIFGLSYDIGFGMDEALSMGMGLTLAPVDFISIGVTWEDADSVLTGVTGDFILDVEVTY